MMGESTSRLYRMSDANEDAFRCVYTLLFDTVIMKNHFRILGKDAFLHSLIFRGFVNDRNRKNLFCVFIKLLLLTVPTEHRLCTFECCHP